MDSNRFDELSRHVARQTDRRGIFKAVAGGALAIVGAGALSRNAAAAGFSGDTCDFNSDCGDGLTCEGASRGLLGGSLAGIPYGPGVPLPFLTGSSGHCRYRNGGCGSEGDACQSNSDCCNGQDLYCPNNHCRKR